MTTEQLLTALLISLSCFVVINFILSFVLWKYSKHHIYGKIVRYWITTIIFFAVQFFFPSTPIQISLAFGVGILPMLYVNIMVSDLLKKKSHYIFFGTLHLCALILTFILWRAGQSFTVMTLPISVSISLPLFDAIITLFFTHRRQSSLLQKMLGGLLFFWIPHCYTFAFFRMVPDAQFLGGSLPIHFMT